MGVNNRDSKIWSVIRVILRIFEVILITLILVFIFLYLVVAILIKGPSKDARRLFVLSAKETSAMGFLPSWYLSDEEIDDILNPKVETDDFTELPIANIIGKDGEIVESVSSAPEVASVGESVDGMQLVDINGPTFKGKMLIIPDASRVKFASIDSFGGVGITLSTFLEKYNAIACTNAGGFEDENGKGKGGIPDGIVVRDGQIVYGSAGGRYPGFAGFDGNNILHVGNMSGQEILNAGVVNGTSFSLGPTLIKDGVRQHDFVSGINPRTCIGQTADGTVLLIAVEGRMADSLGATFDDMADILEEYGAINAANLDGGSSSGMYLHGERITRSCSVVGDRPLPTAIVVTMEGSAQ